jgi:hypothetical protein
MVRQKRPPKTQPRIGAAEKHVVSPPQHPLKSSEKHLFIPDVAKNEATPNSSPAVELSDAELRRAVARAMIAIGRASDPTAALLEHEAVIRAAARRLGPESSVSRLLAALAQARPQTPAIEPEHALPAAAAAAFAEMLADELGLDAAKVRIIEAIGSDAEGWDFNYEQDGVLFGAFCIRHGERWVFAPGPVGREDLFAVTEAFRRHFDFTIALSLHLRGVPDAEISAARDAIQPRRALWAGERDPHGLCDTLPLVFVMQSPDDKRTYYCGYDPITARAEPYDFG